MSGGWMPVLRDARAGSEYFDRAVETEDRIVRRQERALSGRMGSGGRPVVSAAVSVQQSLAREFSACYSRGDGLSRLRELWLSWLEASLRAARAKAEPDAAAQRAAQDLPGSSLELYVYRLWLVAAGLALDVDDAEFARVPEAVMPLLGDRLVSALVASRLEGIAVADACWFPARFDGLAEVFTSDVDVRAAAVSKYLAGWYPRMKGTTWWDGHKFLGKVHYIGYWSFETAGVVEALGIDDAAFRRHDYYPAALLQH